MLTDLLTWAKATPYLKSGSILTFAATVVAVISALQSLPAEATWTAVAFAIGGALLKRFNPADSKTTLTGE